MTDVLTRRQILTAGTIAGAALFCPDALLAGTPSADWTLGIADVEGDIAPRALRRVAGRAPAGLAGTLYRNGPAKFRRGATASGHWFDGDGLIRAWGFDGQGGARLAARFVDTPKRRREAELGRMVMPGFGTSGSADSQVSGPDATNPANTSVIASGGELLALWEAGSPARLDMATLETKGFKTYRPDLAQMPFLAHPRIEPDGRIWNLSQSGKTVLVWRIGKGGALEVAEPVPLPRASYFHDFTATARHLIIVLQPWIQDKFSLPFVESLSWRPEQGTQVLVIDKADLSKRRLFELPAFSFFHLGDAWEEADGTIRFDGAFDADPTFAQKTARGLITGTYIRPPVPLLSMVALHPDGKATLARAGIGAEFPRTNPLLAGLRRRHTVHVGGFAPNRPLAQSVGVWDWERGRDDAFDFGARQMVEEFVFVPRSTRSEIDGWIVGTTLNLDARATELHVFDARRVAAGPVASWRADLPLPISFHGTFVPS